MKLPTKHHLLISLNLHRNWNPSVRSSAFSVSELANYARCPLRYQLENVLRIPVNGQEEPDQDEDEMETALRYTLSRIRQRSDIEKLDATIDQALENHPEVTTESKVGNRSSLLQHVNNFINSELAENRHSLDPQFKPITISTRTSTDTS